MSIDLVILTYHSGALLKSCVESVRNQSVADQVRIIVVDNASGDDSVAVAQRLGLDPIANSTNTGFAAAINQGAAAGRGDYVAILNPDATFGDEKCLDAMLAATQGPEVGVVGARMVSTDGKPYPNGRTFPSTLTAAKHAILGLLVSRNSASLKYFGGAAEHTDTDRVVDWVSGCCLLIRRPLWEKVGGFDKGYWMYLEDMDLSWRLSRRGYKTILSGPAYVIHYGGQSSRFRANKSLYHHHRSAMRFYARTRTGWRAMFVPVAVAFLTARLGILLAVNMIRRLTA